MAVRSGEIDNWDRLDELLNTVRCTGPVSKFEAETLMPKVERLLAAGVKATALTVSDQRIIVQLDESQKAARTQIEELKLEGVNVI